MTEQDLSPRDDTDRHLRQVARGGAFGLVGAGVSAVSGFLLVVAVTNGYDAEAAGTFFSLTSAFLLLTAFTSLGADTGMARFMLRYETQGRRGDILPTLRAAMWPTMALSLLVALGVVLGAAPLLEALGLEGDEATEALVVLAALVPFATYNTLALAATRAFGRIRPTVMIDKILRPAAQPALIALIALSGSGLLLLTVAWSVPYAIAAVASLVLLRRFLDRRDVRGHEATTDTRALASDFWRFTWPRSIARISQMAIQRADILIIAALRSPAEAALYTAATRFVALGQFGTQATQQVLQPKFTALIAADDHDNLRSVHQVSTAWNIILAWPLYLAVAAGPLAYLGLFGEGYATSDATLVVLLMSLGMLFSVATGPVDTLLLMSGRSTLSLVNSLVALAIDLVLCFVLIPDLGIVGAAIGWAVAVTVRSALAVVQTRSALGIASFGPAVRIAIAANVLCFGLPLAVLSALLTPGLLGMGLLVLAVLPLYALALWWGREALMLSTLGGLLRTRARGPS